MKLLKKIFNSSIVINIRNLIGFRPVKVKIPKTKKNLSISDTFIWRTDNNFHTVFRFGDILKKFYKTILTTQIEIIFYDKNNLQLKKILLKDYEINNELIIDKYFLNNIEGYGIFCIYHSSKHEDSLSENISLSNKCYVGYSINKSNPSFVHGNYLSRFKIFDDHKEYTNLVQKTLFSQKKYKIQTSFLDYDKTELFFANPTKHFVKFKVNDDKFLLKPGAIDIIEIGNIDVVEISSKLMFFRPIIFNYKGKFLDVLHA